MLDIKIRALLQQLRIPDDMSAHASDAVDVFWPEGERQVTRTVPAIRLEAMLATMASTSVRHEAAKEQVVDWCLLHGTDRDAKFRERGRAWAIALGIQGELAEDGPEVEDRLVVELGNVLEAGEPTDHYELQNAAVRFAEEHPEVVEVRALPSGRRLRNMEDWSASIVTGAHDHAVVLKVRDRERFDALREGMTTRRSG